MIVGHKGKDVVQLQKALIALGYALPKWGADGILGTETIQAALAFAAATASGLSWSDKDELQGVPDEIVLFIKRAAQEKRDQATDGTVFDLTSNHPITKGRQTLRNWEDITGIMLHQTACTLGPKWTRWYDVACHIGIPASGQIFYVNKLPVYLWHGHGLNSTTVGFEIDGSFEGIDGDSKTHWKAGGGPHRVSEKQIQSARRAIEWAMKQVAAHGGRIKYIYAHRQSSDQRESDPGSRVWQEIGVWAQQNLGLKNEPLFTKGTGLPIPEEWDPRSTVNYYGKQTRRGVRWIQSTLNLLVDARLTVDGVFGLATKHAVAAFQIKNGLGADAIVGPGTRAKLEALRSRIGAQALLGSRYRHFKGGVYVTCGTATHSETDETLVLYRTENDMQRTWARPLSMWNDVVTDPETGKQVKRFVCIDEETETK